MAAPQRRRNEHLDRLVQKLTAPVARQHQRRLVHQHDRPGLVDHDHRRLRRVPGNVMRQPVRQRCTDIHRRDHGAALPVKRDRVQPQLQGHVFAVLANPDQFPPVAHRAFRRATPERRDMGRVRPAYRLRHQHLDRLSDQFARRIAEKPLHLRVEGKDTPIAGHHEHGNRGKT